MSHEVHKTKRESVTPVRHFSGKMSGSRNGTRTRDVDAGCCYWCRDRFAPGANALPDLARVEMPAGFALPRLLQAAGGRELRPGCDAESSPARGRGIPRQSQTTPSEPRQSLARDAAAEAAKASTAAQGNDLPRLRRTHFRVAEYAQLPIKVLLNALLPACLSQAAAQYRKHNPMERRARPSMRSM
jgi:hypothetical protein